MWPKHSHDTPESIPHLRKQGDYVVAHNDQTKVATFKQLMHDGGVWYLKPLNPAYPTISIDDPNLCVIGVAIEWQLGGKL